MQRVLSAVFAATMIFAGTAYGQQAAAPPAASQPAIPGVPPSIDFSKIEIKTTDLGKKTYMLSGLGGNMTVAVGDDGIILVDSQFAPLHEKVKAALAAVSSQPVKFVVNTHFHADHTGGNEAFAQDGATIVANLNVRTRLAEGTTNGLSGVKTPPAPPGALPTQTYTDKTTLKVKGRTAKVMHEPAAHTDGDSAIYFADANVLATGDIVTVGGRYPNIDVANGGNIKGMIAAVEAYLKIANAETKIVPGHGPLLTKTDLTDYRDFLVTARDRVAKLISEGKSEDEAVAAKAFVDLEAKAGANEQGSANFVRVIYRSLKA